SRPVPPRSTSTTRPRRPRTTSSAPVWCRTARPWPGCWTSGSSRRYRTDLTGSRTDDRTVQTRNRSHEPRRPTRDRHLCQPRCRLPPGCPPAVAPRSARRSMTMTAPAPSRGPEHRTRRRTTQTVLTIPVIVALLIPVVYLFGRQWSTTSGAAGTVTTERATIAYARPLHKLLSALVDVEYAAARRSDVDASPVKAAIEEVNGVDRRLSDPLQIRPRWSGLTHEIDSAIGQNATGAAALHAYASAIALTQALLER